VIGLPEPAALDDGLAVCQLGVAEPIFFMPACR
jgi:hypothetical protein